MRRCPFAFTSFLFAAARPIEGGGVVAHSSWHSCFQSLTRQQAKAQRRTGIIGIIDQGRATAAIAAARLPRRLRAPASPLSENRRSHTHLHSQLRAVQAFQVTLHWACYKLGANGDADERGQNRAQANATCVAGPTFVGAHAVHIACSESLAASGICPDSPGNGGSG